MIEDSVKNEVCVSLSVKSGYDELEGILTETHLKVLSQNLPENTEESHG
jgi:hypothetical protein